MTAEATRRRTTVGRDGGGVPKVTTRGWSGEFIHQFAGWLLEELVVGELVVGWLLEELVVGGLVVGWLMGELSIRPGDKCQNDASMGCWNKFLVKLNLL